MGRSGRHLGCGAGGRSGKGGRVGAGGRGGGKCLVDEGGTW